MDNYRSFLEKILMHASKIANNNFGKVQSSIKPEDNNQVLTQTDLDIGKFIVKEIQKTFPEHSIIDEESGVINNNSPYVWATDPIDGTSNFAAGFPIYGIMIGLLYKDIPIAAGIALPYLEEVVTAEKGKGTWKGNQKLTVTHEKALNNALVNYHMDSNLKEPQKIVNECTILPDLIQSIRNFRSVGTIAYESIAVAEGKFGASIGQTGKIYDLVAPHLIAEEAGAICTDYYGRPMNYTDCIVEPKRSYTRCFAAPQFHKQLIGIINK